jgi:hypothetical protein
MIRLIYEACSKPRLTILEIRIHLSRGDVIIIIIITK